MDNDKVSVRAGQFPGKVADLDLGPDEVHNVQTVVTRLNLKIEGFEIRVGGERANLETLLKEGDTVLFVKKIQGN